MSIRALRQRGTIVGFRGEIVQVKSPTCCSTRSSPAQARCSSLFLGFVKFTIVVVICLSIADTGGGIDPQHRERYSSTFSYHQRGTREKGLAVGVHGIIMVGGRSTFTAPPGAPVSGSSCLPRSSPLHQQQPISTHRDLRAGTSCALASPPSVPWLGTFSSLFRSEGEQK